MLEDLVAATPRWERATLVAVDGVDGSGKTSFAARLSEAYEGEGQRAHLVHEDDFLNPRAVRYRLGRDSPAGFFLDSYDLPALRQKVLDPLRRGGRSIVAQHFDHTTDSPIHTDPTGIEPGDVVIVEGMFLHRDELTEYWDFSVFLDVPFTISVGRMAQRDGTSPDPEDVSNHRYIEGQKIYLSRCRPQDRATTVVDNSGSRTDPSP
ncbi:nucleoside/nucleotide kinase family protein [Nesterenkonia ebinurensis]|uniref:uridine kinase n=1 Tax=Nesterenkonia ebinurensis TaxID=2608252 RepID=UPI00123CF4C3|nr:uridine kinase [Nesterenkonia ebinurensis]